MGFWQVLQRLRSLLGQTVWFRLVALDSDVRCSSFKQALLAPG